MLLSANEIGMESSALSDFTRSMLMASQMYDLEVNLYSDPPSANDLATVQGLRGGAAVLMVAVFEAFLREVFEERLAVLSAFTPPVQLSSLPEQLRVHNAFESLSWAMKGEPYQSAGRKVDRLAKIDTVARNIVAGIVSPAVFAHTGGNPNAGRVKDMFERVGVSNVFGRSRSAFESAWGTPVAETFIRDKLEEIVSRRHSVAHSPSGLTISRLQIDEAMRFLATLTQVLDSILEQHIDGFCKGVLS